VDNRLKKRKKKHFAADLERDARSVAGFSTFRQFRVGRNDVIYKTRPGCQLQFQNGNVQSAILGLFRDEFLQDGTHFRS